MAFENIIYDLTDGIVTITINRPKALNALNKATVQEIEQCVDQIATDKNVQVVIITGAGDKSFVAGADIKEMAPYGPSESADWAAYGAAVITKIEKLPQPVIAAVNGFALGGGCEISMAADFRYCSENAVFGQPEVGLGIIPGFGGTQRLARLVGMGAAKEIIYSSKNIKADEAYRIGLVNKVVPQAELMAEAVKAAKKIQKQGPVAVQIAKKAINNGINTDIITGLAFESNVFGLCFATKDQKEGMQAFMEKRKPEFKGE